MEDIVIRKYKREDRQAVRDIAWETAFMGKPADVFFSDREIFADFLTGECKKLLKDWKSLENEKPDSINHQTPYFIKGRGGVKSRRGRG